MLQAAEAGSGPAGPWPQRGLLSLAQPWPGPHLKEDDEGQADGENEPELLGQVVVTPGMAVVPVPGVGQLGSVRGAGITGLCGASRGGGSRPALGHVLWTLSPRHVWEVLGVEDGQAMVDVAREAAGGGVASVGAGPVPWGQWG